MCLIKSEILREFILPFLGIICVLTLLAIMAYEGAVDQEEKSHYKSHESIGTALFFINTEFPSINGKELADKTLVSDVLSKHTSFRKKMKIINRSAISRNRMKTEFEEASLTIGELKTILREIQDDLDNELGGFDKYQKKLALSDYEKTLF
jgi:hypothetical protein